MTQQQTPKPAGIQAHVHAPGAWFYLTWNSVPGADAAYESQHEGEGGHIAREASPRTTLIAVAPGTTRYTLIRNVVAGVPSRWVKVTLSESGEIVAVDDPDQPKPDPNRDAKPPHPAPVPGKPARPTNVRAHCITYNSAKIEWDRDPKIDEYEVWVDGHRDAAQRTRDTLVTVTGLKQNTSYSAHVAAHTADGKQSEPGSVQFRTGVPEPAPEPDTAAD